jgi:hypothetical protein
MRVMKDKRSERAPDTAGEVAAFHMFLFSTPSSSLKIKERNSDIYEERYV